MNAAWPECFACGVASHDLTLSSTIVPQFVKSLPEQCLPPNLSVALPKQSCIIFGIWKASYLVHEWHHCGCERHGPCVPGICVLALCAEAYLALYAKSGVVT